MTLSPSEQQSGGLVRDVDGRVSIALPSGASTEVTLAKRFGGAKTGSATLLTTAGDTTIYTPTAGKTVTLYWIGLSSSANNGGEVLATVKLGSLVVYEWYMGNPGAFSHWEPVIAQNANDALIVNLSGAANVAVNYTLSAA